ncbi:hypothetical protein LJB89_02790 [Tyzzerella sp. OttesenSCG-928-J15]|nr:hypothetical protein [Tyzzerella sp. OttesenSCG-928-J15]
MSKIDDYYKLLVDERNGINAKELEKQLKNAKAREMAHTKTEAIAEYIFAQLVKKIEIMTVMKEIKCNVAVNAAYINSIYFNYTKDIDMATIIETFEEIEEDIIERLKNKVDALIESDNTKYKISNEWAEKIDGKTPNYIVFFELIFRG